MDLTKVLTWVLPMVVLGIFSLLQLPICPSRVLFGLFCPGCGLTRGSLALLQGDLSGMLHYHPLAFLMGPMLAWIMLHGLLVELGRWKEGGKSDLLQSLPRAAWITIAVAFMGVWIARILGALGGLPDPVFEAEQSLIFGGRWPDG